MMQQVNTSIYNYMQGPSEFTITGTLKHYDGTSFLPKVRDPVKDAAEPPSERCLRAAVDEARAWGAQLLVVKGEQATGSYLPDAAVPAFAARVGAGHILTIKDGAHSPQRMLPEATLVAFLRAMD